MIFYKPKKNSSHFLSPIIVALDYRDKNKALAFVDKINPQYCQLKVGNEMFTLYGPEWIKELQKRGFQVFLDLKFHDIPNTTARSVASAAELGVWMVNVHASGGGHMMEAAKKTLLPYGKEAPLLIAVTLLTSMTTQDLQPIGIYGEQQEQVTRLAKLSQDSGMDGVVCSAQEAQMLRQHCGSSFQLVTPGIRPLNSVNFDQSRTMDPKEALKAGANYLVIGRPITGSEHPVQSLKNLYTLMNDPNSHLIYSTDKNAFPKLEKREPLPIQKDALIRLEYQTHGRKGKGVSLVIGLKGGDEAISSLAAELKKQCGCGGTVKQGIIEIQGDKIAFLKKRLEAKGFKVRLVRG